MNNRNEFIAESTDTTPKKSWSAPQLMRLAIDETAIGASSNPDANNDANPS